MNKNNITYYASKLLGILTFNHPLRTAKGALFGYTLDIIRRICSPLWASITSINLALIDAIDCLILGIFISFIPSFGNFIFGKNIALPEDIEAALRGLEIAHKNGNLSEAEVRANYRTLTKKIIDRVALKPKVKSNVELLKAINHTAASRTESDDSLN